ncbi:MAG: hypothetical protein KAU01_04045 [Candidatus Cloacimonetes bacterium]|nr:hypothetical protein [Candidatus Cloacimonadota bacterium]
MKKILLIFVIIIFTTIAFAQEGTTVKSTKSAEYKNLKKLKSKTEDEVKVDIRKPDNASLMPRTETDHSSDMKLNVIDKFKKSNKLLY